jgi:AcrR family transcriptional regulator
VDAAREVTQRTFRIGGLDIAGGHVCGAFEGDDDLYAQLTGFVAEGIERGERAVHIIDPSTRREHVDRLAAAGIDVDGAIARGQLDIREWADVYLIDGRFEPTRTVAVVRNAIDSGRQMGYPATRAIGFMAWAIDDAPGVEAVSAYEARLDAELGRTRDVVVCAYDVRRHRPSVIVDVLAIHPYTLVEGQLRGGAPRQMPRDRILATAARLFHRRGIAATGVDRVIAEAGVAKATFYRQYGSKEDLVLAWIDDPSTNWFDRLLEAVHATGPSPNMVVPRLFDSVAEWIELDDFRGCPYLNTLAELGGTDGSPRVRAAATAHIDGIGDQLRDASVAAGADPSVGDQIQAVLAGSIQLAAARRSIDPIRQAREAAVILLAERDSSDEVA